MSEGPGRKNVYVCRACGGSIITINRDAGVTPMFIRCCACESGTMASGMYPPGLDAAVPTHEWYAPKIKRSMSEAEKDHYQSGGLALRPVVEDRAMTRRRR